MSTTTITMPMQDVPNMLDDDAMAESKILDANKPVAVENATDVVEEASMTCAHADAPAEGLRATGEATEVVQNPSTSNTASDSEPPSSPSNSSNSSNSSPKKKRAVKPKDPAAKPKSYPQAILHVVWNGGLLSRASITTECKKLSFDKPTCIKPALSKCLKEGLVVIDSSWYSIGGDLANDEGYKARLEQGMQLRDEMHAEKQASRQRADAKYVQNIKEAGGLTLKAQSDLAWVAGQTDKVRAANEGLIVM